MPRTLQEIIDAGDVPAANNILSADDKEHWADLHRRFTIHGIEYGEDGDYGPYWEVGISRGTNPYSFRLSQHDARDDQMKALKQVVAKESIDDCVLIKRGSRGGNYFLVIGPATEPELESLPTQTPF